MPRVDHIKMRISLLEVADELEIRGLGAVLFPRFLDARMLRRQQPVDRDATRGG